MSPTSDTTTLRRLAQLTESKDLFDPAFGPILLEGIVNGLPDAVIIVDRLGQIVLVNQQAEFIFGYPRRLMVGRNIDMLLPEEHRAAHSAHLLKFFERPTVRPMGDGRTFQALHETGSEISVQINLSAIVTCRGIYGMAAIRRST